MRTLDVTIIYLSTHPGATAESAARDGFTENDLHNAFYGGYTRLMGDGKHFLTTKGRKAAQKWKKENDG